MNTSVCLYLDPSAWAGEHLFTLLEMTLIHVHGFVFLLLHIDRCIHRCRSFMGNEGRGRDRGRERGRGNRRQWLRTEGQDGGDQAAVTIRYEGELELQDEVKEESPVVEEEKERGTKADTETETEKGGDRKVTRKKRRKTRIPFSFSQTTPSTFPAELMAGDELVFKMRYVQCA